MESMNDADRFPECDVSEEEFDRMFAEGEPVELVAARDRTLTMFGTVEVTHGGGIAQPSRTSGTYVSTSTDVSQAAL